MPGEPRPLTIRPFHVGDDVASITKLLRRAYQRLADLGLRYNATWQPDEKTFLRLTRDRAFLGFAGDQLAGAIAYEGTAVTGGCPWYDRPDVASFHQSAVEPGFQGNGIGTRLLATVEDLARSEGARELALDTAQSASHLISLYARWGFREVGSVQWESTNYRSVILSKPLH